MKTDSIRKAMVVGIAVLIGVSACVSVWFVLRAHKGKTPLVYDVPSSNNGLTTQYRKAPQQSQHSDAEPLTLEERTARDLLQFRSIHTEEQLASPEVQKLLEVIDSPAFIKYLEKGDNSSRAWNEFLGSQGLSSLEPAFFDVFRNEFPTGSPADYEPEMRQQIAEMFLVTEPVAPINVEEATLQRARVVAELMTKERRGRAWFMGQFGIDWDGVFQVEQSGMENNPSLKWMSDVQRNAASIVANAETAGIDSPATERSASSWDMSSVGESPSASHSGTEIPATLDTKETRQLTNTAIEAEIERSLTSQPPDIPAAPSPDKLGEIQSNLEASLKEQFSKGRFDRAMSTLEQHGQEEGLRRLRENDPEVAKQIDQHRKQEEVPK